MGCGSVMSRIPSVLKTKQYINKAKASKQQAATHTTTTLQAINQSIDKPTTQ
jgi:hypothetical protein